MVAMETPLVELTRVLYHLDYFRRNFRQLGWHNCGGSDPVKKACVVCSFKSLFSDLSQAMRDVVLDPPHIHHVIESNIEGIRGKVGIPSTTTPSSSSNANNSIAQAATYESFIRHIEDSFMTVSNAQSQTPTKVPGLQLHSEFNVTKICLHCRTTSYVESVNQYTMQIDSSTLLSNDWPSFEFAIKTSLDSEEFCVQPNCHGQTKVFRLIKSLPPILPICFIDPTPGSLITLIPSRLRPHLIFETSKSISDLSLKAVVLYSPQWGYATLFHHSRLDLWIFIDSRRVLSLHRTWIESRFHPITFGFLVYFCFYCKEDGGPIPEARTPAPVVPQHKVSMPPPTPRVSSSSSPVVVIASPAKVSPVVVLQKPQSSFESDARIYENWPLDSDSGQGSEFSSNCSSSASASASSSGQSVTRSPSTASASASFFASSSSGIYYRTEPSKPHLIFETMATPAMLALEGLPPVPNNKYATVRRKIKYQRRGSKNSNHPHPPSLSLSVPDLTSLTGTHPTPPSLHPHASTTTITTASINTTAIMRRHHSPRPLPHPNPHDPPPPEATCLPLPLPLPSIIGNGNSKRTSVDSAGNRKVSFNCEVTLVDDMNDDYIPHPIFQSVLQKLQQKSQPQTQVQVHPPYQQPPPPRPQPQPLRTDI